MLWWFQYVEVSPRSSYSLYFLLTLKINSELEGQHADCFIKSADTACVSSTGNSCYFPFQQMISTTERSVRALYPLLPDLRYNRLKSETNTNHSQQMAAPPLRLVLEEVSSRQKEFFHSTAANWLPIRRIGLLVFFQKYCRIFILQYRALWTDNFCNFSTIYKTELNWISSLSFWENKTFFKWKNSFCIPSTKTVQVVSV